MRFPKQIAVYDQKFLVSTIQPGDATQYPYETAIEHPAYGDGELIVVDGAETFDDAIRIHNKWIDKLDVSFGQLPEVVIEFANSPILQMMRIMDPSCRQFRKEKY